MSKSGDKAFENDIPQLSQLGSSQGDRTLSPFLSSAGNQTGMFPVQPKENKFLGDLSEVTEGAVWNDGQPLSLERLLLFFPNDIVPNDSLSCTSSFLPE